MVTLFIGLAIGLVVGFFISALLSTGVRSDLEVANLLLKDDNKKIRTQLHTMLMQDSPYECGSDENVDLIDLGPDHDGPLRFIANPSK